MRMEVKVYDDRKADPPGPLFIRLARLERELALAFADAEYDWFGLRMGRLYVSVRDIEAHRAYFSERNRLRCRHLTVGRSRLVVRWR